MAKQSWGDMTRGKRCLVIVSGIGAAILGVAMLIDLKRRPADQIRGPKWLWVPAAFLDYLGPIVYFAWGRRRRDELQQD